MLKKIVGFFLSWKILLLFLAFLAMLIIPLNWGNTYIRPFHQPNAPYNYQIDPPYYIWIWANFDGAHYLSIARSGYLDFQYGFFPLYPVIIDYVHNLFQIRYIYAGIIISNLFFLLSLFIIWALLKIDDKKKLFSLFFLILILFPTSFFYGAAYNDSLFFFLATLSIYFARRESWILASISAGIATLTRLNGLALFFLIFFEYILSIRKSFTGWSLDQLLASLKSQLQLSKIFKSKFYFVILIPLAFVGYLAYIQSASGSWTHLFTSMSIWNQDRFILPLQVLWRYTKIIFTASPHHLNYWIAVSELFFVFLYIFLLIFSFKKIRFSYWVFFFISILIPSFTGTFQGMPRYGLHLYPFFLSLTIFLSNQSLLKKIAYFVVSILLLFLFVGLFTRGYFVA